jgi:hypothetical protein
MNFRLSRSILSSFYKFIHDEIRYKKLQFDEFVDLWVPRNAKALKGPILAGEGISHSSLASVHNSTCGSNGTFNRPKAVLHPLICLTLNLDSQCLTHPAGTGPSGLESMESLL